MEEEEVRVEEARWEEGDEEDRRERGKRGGGEILHSRAVEPAAVDWLNTIPIGSMMNNRSLERTSIVSHTLKHDSKPALYRRMGENSSCGAAGAGPGVDRTRA